MTVQTEKICFGCVLLLVGSPDYAVVPAAKPVEDPCTSVCHRCYHTCLSPNPGSG